jgi:LCP family protein required for cell wall assembly
MPDESSPESPAVAESPAASPAVAAPRRRRRRRTWAQRGLLTLNIVVITACFAGSGALLAARSITDGFAKVAIDTPSATTPPDAVTTTVAAVVTQPGDPAPTAPEITGPPETFPAVDPEAKNFLITGADNNACIDPTSPYAPAFGNRDAMGARSDTIMVLRVDPSTNAAAVLSFPRDLYVKIAGTNGRRRINEAYVRDDPQKLIDTIFQNFGVPIDHFVQVDFCAFKNLVDGLGGVAVPFEFPARDRNTGLNVPTAGCFTFDGDHALAYVRSRKYQYQDDDGRWKSDGTSDLGRITRQQDFIRRVLKAALDRGVTDPRVARSLIDVASDNVVTDRGLTINRMLEFAGLLRNLEPQSIASYQIEAVGANIAGNSVLEPRIKGENMQAILRIFKGEAALAGAPVQVFETSTTVAAPTTSAGSASGSPTTVRPGSATTTSAAPTTTVPAVTTSTEPPPEQNNKGIFPPAGVACG